MMTDNAVANAPSISTTTTAMGNAANIGAPLSVLERRIEMSVARADVDRDVEQRLKRLSRTVKIAGFRPGKVPMKMVAQQYGYQAHSEALNEAVQRVFSEQVRSKNLRVAGYPKIEAKPATSDSQLEFSAVFEIYPEIVPADVSTSVIEKPVLTVSEAEVDKTLDVLRKQRTTYEMTDRAAEKNDRATIDFTGRKDGEVFQGGEAKDHVVIVGGGQMLPEFDAQLDGVTVGQTKTFDLTFPAEYQATELAGATVQFEVTIKKIEAAVLPAIDADFAKSLGITDGDLEKMRAEVRSNLEREVKKRLQAKIKNQVMDLLLSVNPVEVPRALVEAEAQQMAESTRREMESRGMAMKNVPMDLSWFGEQATRRVKLGLLLAELVRSKELHAKPDQVRSIVDDFAETFEDPKEVVRWYYSQPQRLAEAESLALENNVVEWVLKNAKVNESSIAFDDLMANAA
jgi:trigger factor